MSLVMDGVRPTSKPVRRPSEVHPRKAVNVVAPAPGAALDGMRRRQVAAVPPPHVAVAERAGERPAPWRGLHWQRPAAAVGFVVVALMASTLAVRTLATPRATTARADSEVAAAHATPRATPASSQRPTRTIVQQQAALQQLLNQFVASHGSDGSYNLAVKDLSTGATASVNPDQSYESASLYKLFVASQIYHLVDSGSLSYGTAAGSGSGNTIQRCLGLMISISDNTCGRALGDILNWGTQNPALAAEGFGETDLTTPQQTSARDVASLLERLYAGTLNSPTSNSSFLALLKQQKVNDRLPQGLPAGTVIAHKTGNLDNVVHDAGIIYGPKTNYVVVVMSGNWSATGKAPAQFANLSQQLWNFFEQ